MGHPWGRERRRWTSDLLKNPRVSLSRLPLIVTDVELKVLIGAARGETAQQTAKRMNRSLDTIKTHKARLVYRMGAENIVHAVALAVMSGWIKEEDLREEGSMGDV